MPFRGRYARVEDGEVVEGPVRLPRTWRNVSNLAALSDESLARLGWFPADEQRPPTFSHADEVWEPPAFDVQADRVVATFGKRSKTPEERDDTDDRDARKILDALLDGRTLGPVVAEVVRHLGDAAPGEAKRFLARYDALRAMVRAQTARGPRP